MDPRRPFRPAGFRGRSCDEVSPKVFGGQGSRVQDITTRFHPESRRWARDNSGGPRGGCLRTMPWYECPSPAAPTGALATSRVRPAKTLIGPCGSPSSNVILRGPQRPLERYPELSHFNRGGYEPPGQVAGGVPSPGDEVIAPAVRFSPGSSGDRHSGATPSTRAFFFSPRLCPLNPCCSNLDDVAISRAVTLINLPPAQTTNLHVPLSDNRGWCNCVLD